MAFKEPTQAEKEAAAKGYSDDRIAWEYIVRGILAGEPADRETTEKVLAAKRLMELAGGYKEAFVVLDATMVAIETPDL